MNIHVYIPTVRYSYNIKEKYIVVQYCKCCSTYMYCNKYSKPDGSTLSKGNRQYQDRVDERQPKSNTVTVSTVEAMQSSVNKLRSIGPA